MPWQLWCLLYYLIHFLRPGYSALSCTSCCHNQIKPPWIHESFSPLQSCLFPAEWICSLPSWAPRPSFGALDVQVALHHAPHAVNASLSSTSPPPLPSPSCCSSPCLSLPLLQMSLTQLATWLVTQWFRIQGLCFSWGPRLSSQRKIRPLPGPQIPVPLSWDDLGLRYSVRVARASSPFFSSVQTLLALGAPFSFFPGKVDREDLTLECV